MIVLAVVSQKGGVGKSMLTRSLAVQALIDGMKTAILDADPQGSIVQWRTRRKPTAPTVRALGGESIEDALRQLKSRGAQLTIIDTPPHSQPIINMAVTEAHAALLVTGPNPEDLEQVGVAAAIVRSLNKPSGIILNRTSSKATALSLARAALTAFGLPICPTAISQLVAHPYASADGQTAQEREPDSKATAELADVWAWIKDNIIVS